MSSENKSSIVDVSEQLTQQYSYLFVHKLEKKIQINTKKINNTKTESMLLLNRMLVLCGINGDILLDQISINLPIIIP